MRTGTLAIGLLVLAASVALAGAQATQAIYPAMAPAGQYMMASPADEVALARSAAPPSIAGDAEVLTLGSHGYETAAQGKNGFVCMVWRAWTAGLNDAEFWNPKSRAPICLNPAAVRTVLPEYLERTRWVLAGVSKPDIIGRTKAAIAANRFTLPAPGAMAFMMSKQGFLGDEAGHWHPHLMFFVPHTDSIAWGADLAGSPVLAAQDSIEPTTTFFVPVAKWSDGSAAVGEH